MSGGRVVDGDIDSGDGGGVKRSLSGGDFSHAFSSHGEPVGVVDEAVQDGVGERRVADGVAPLVDGELAGDDRRGALVAIFEDFEQVALLGFGEDRQPPVVEDQELDAGEGFEQAGVSAVAAGERERLEEPRRPVIEDASPVPAGFVAESAGDPALADSGRSHDILPRNRAAKSS